MALTLGTAGLAVTSIGIDTCIKTVTMSAQGIYSIVTTLTSPSTTPSISYVIKELDLIAEVSVLETLLKEIDLNKHHTETLTLCVKSLEECVLQIEKNLKIVQERSDYNNSLWILTSLRSYGFDDLISTLKLLKLNLSSRKKTLFNVLKINNFLVSKPATCCETDTVIVEK